jgi:ribosomal protein L30/L7E
MKRVIISWNSYDWLYSFLHLIEDSEDSFEVIIVCGYSDETSKNNPKLCREARYEQRKFDMIKIGKELGIKKISNLGYCEDNPNIYKLITQLSLYFGVSNMKEVYCTDNAILLGILKSIKNIKVNKLERICSMNATIKDLMVGE